MAWSAVETLRATTIFTISSMDTVVDQWTVRLVTNIVSKQVFGIILIMMIMEWFRVVAMVTTSQVYIDHPVIWFIVLKNLCAAQ